MKEAEGRGAANEIHEALHAQKQHLHEAGRDQNMLLPEGWQRTEQSIGRLGLNWTFLEEYNEDSKNNCVCDTITFKKGHEKEYCGCVLKTFYGEYHKKNVVVT